MASVRASVVNQAHKAATSLVSRAEQVDAATCPEVDRLLRCAALSEDAAHTLEWAMEIMRAHSDDRAGQVACQLLAAARARLDAGEVPDDVAAATRSRSLAWI